MARLDLAVDATQAEASARTFQRVITDIQRTVLALDNLTFNNAITRIDRLISNIVKLEDAAERVVTSLGAIQYTLNSIAVSPHLTTLHNKFSGIRDVIREMQTSLKGFETSMGTAARASERMRPPTRATASPTQTQAAAPEITKALAIIPTNIQPAIHGIERFNFELLHAVHSSQQLSASLIILKTFDFRNVMGSFNFGLLDASQSARTLIENMGDLRSINLRSSIVEQIKSVDLELVKTNVEAKRLLDLLSKLPTIDSRTQLGSFESRAGLSTTTPITNRLTALHGPQFGPQPFGASGMAIPGMERMITPLSDITKEGGKLREEIKHVKTEKDKLDKNMDSMSRGSLANFYRGFQTLRVLLAGFTIFALVRGFREFSDELIETGRELQHAKALFTAAARGNVDEADRLRVVARNLANEFGAPLLAMEQNFAKFAGAAQGTNLQGKLLDDTFRGVASAVAVLGVGSEKATNIIKVFTDIMGKGRVQSEEVVKQFGNAVPGAYRRVADALGMTTAQLTQALQRGTLLATKVVADVGKELGRIYENVAKQQANTLIGSFNSLQNAIIQFKEAILLGGAETGFIDFFKGLASILRDEGMLASAREIGEAFGKTLRTALDVLGPILRFVTEQWRIFASLFVGGAVFAGIMLIVSGLGLLAVALKALSIAVLPGLGVIGIIAGLVAMVANLTLFSSNTDKATEKTEEFTKRNRELAEQAAASAQAHEEQSRAFIQAQERMSKELRTFAEDQRAAAEAIDLVNSGMSALGLQFETFTKVGERVRALVRAGTFLAFGEDAEKQQKAFTDQALAITKVSVALGLVVKMQKELNELQESTRAEQFTAATTSRLGTALTQNAVSLQTEYDRRVIPVLERTREIIASFTDPADKEKADFIAQGFDVWNKKLLETLKISHDIKTEMQGMANLANSFRDLQSSQRVLQLSAGIRSGRGLAAGQSPLDMARQFVPEAIGARAQLQARMLPGFEGRTDAASKQALEIFKKTLDDFEAMNKLPADKMVDAGNKILEGATKFDKGVDKFTGTSSTGGVVAGGVGGLSRTTGGTFDFSKNQYAGMIQQSSAKYGIDPEWAARVILRGEASGASAVSPKGATGVAQVLPTTAAGLSGFEGMSLSAIQEALKDPATSIDAGIQYLRKMLDNPLFHGNVGLATAAYNTGPGNVQRVGGDFSKMAAETQAYVPRVLEGYQGSGRGASAGGTPWYLEPLAAAGRIVGGMKTQDPISDYRKLYNDLIKTHPDIPTKPLQRGGGPIDLSSVQSGSVVPGNMPVNVPMGAPVNPLQAQGVDLSGLFNEIQTTLTKMASTQGVQFTPEQELEKQMTTWKATEKVVRDLGVTQEDVDKKTQKYFQALFTGAIAGQDAVNQLILRGDQHLKQLENENKDIQDQIRLLETIPALRDLEATAIQRRNQAEAQGGLTTEKQRKLFEERDAALRASQDMSRQKTFMEQFMRQSVEENALSRTQLDMLKLEPHLRDTAAEKLRRYVEVKKQHLAPEFESAALREIDHWEQLAGAIQGANGPMQEYIDSLSEAKRTFGERSMVELFRGTTSATTDAVFGLRERLQDRNKDVNAAEGRLADARRNLKGISPFDRFGKDGGESEGFIKAKQDLTKAEREFKEAKDARPSVGLTVLEPFKGFLDNFSKNIFQQGLDQLTKPLLEAMQQKFGFTATQTPVVAAVDSAANKIVAAIDRANGFGKNGSFVNGSGMVRNKRLAPGSADALATDLNFESITRIPNTGTTNIPSLTPGGLDIASIKDVNESFEDFDAGLSNVNTNLDTMAQQAKGFDSALGLGIGALGVFGSGLLGMFSGGGKQGLGSILLQGALAIGSAYLGSGISLGSPGGTSGSGSVGGLGSPIGGTSGSFAAWGGASGGIVGTDNYPALLTRGEGVFTAAQMSKLSPAGEQPGGNTLVMNINSPTDVEGFRKSSNQLYSDANNQLFRLSKRSGNPKT